MEVFVDRDSEEENVAVEEDFREEELLGWIPDVDEDEEDEVWNKSYSYVVHTFIEVHTVTVKPVIYFKPFETLTTDETDPM